MTYDNFSALLNLVNGFNKDKSDPSSVPYDIKGYSIDQFFELEIKFDLFYSSHLLSLFDFVKNNNLKIVCVCRKGLPFFKIY